MCNRIVLLKSVCCVNENNMSPCIVGVGCVCTHQSINQSVSRDTQAGPSSVEGAAALDEIKTKLNEAVVGLDKSGKVADKIYVAAGRVDDVSSRFTQTRDDLKTAMEAADGTASDLNFMSKHSTARTETVSS